MITVDLIPQQCNQKQYKRELHKFIATQSPLRTSLDSYNGPGLDTTLRITSVAQTASRAVNKGKRNSSSMNPSMKGNNQMITLRGKTNIYN